MWESHLGKIDDVQLPGTSIDAAIMVDAYHEFSHPNEMMQSICHAPKAWRSYLFVRISRRGPCRANQTTAQDDSGTSDQRDGSGWIRARTHR